MNKPGQINRLIIGILGLLALVLGSIFLAKGIADTAFYWVGSGMCYLAGLILLLGIISSFYQPKK